ncbi:MFS transporter [Nocardioides bizhenqiangii]|uniref:MFS transporter n=1 Tax=Nocardioides bizhenqiangii TaxID=3095076 RepID=A0ABZ0ZZC0_9ACTN|nr:MFS transporter [Nocardioides sp. HM61]WQQ28433.1 MFS transporter [Nocardioides sp. HM61]
MGRLFRLLLGVQFMNATAVWVHVVAVQWILTERGEPATVVALAPTAVAVPFLVLALPVGVIVSHAVRERLIARAAAVAGLAGAAAALLVVSGTDAALPLLATIVVVGAALVVVGVAWQSLLPEIVDREALPSAVLLDGAIFNLARAVGPLVAGVVLGLGLPGVLFGAVAAMFAVCSLLLLLLGPATAARPRRTESVVTAIGGALRFVRHSPWTTGLLVRLVMFGLPSSALWALVSLVVHERLALGGSGFGVAMALIGAGSVAAAVTLGRLRARVSAHLLVATFSSCYAINLAALALLGELWLLAPFLVLGGIAWVVVQSTWMMLAHQALPDWVRPRVVAFLLMLFQGTQAVGALAWGAVADVVGLERALGLAATLLLLYAVTLLAAGLRTSVGIEPVPATPDAAIAELVREAAEGELLVRFEYAVAATEQSPFRDAMGDLRRSRLRLGARSWSLEPDPARPSTFVESYRVRDRSLLLEQETTRLTVPEQRLRDVVRALTSRATGPTLTPVRADRSITEEAMHD